MPVITGGTIIEGGGPQRLANAGVPVAGTDEVQTVTIDATAGTFRLAYQGSRTTAIAFGATSATVQAALRALPTIVSPNVTVAGDAPVHTVTFVAGLGKLDVSLLTADASALTKNGGADPGTAIVAVGTPGVTASGRGSAKGTHLTDVTNGVDYVNTGTALAPTWTAVGVASISQEIIDIAAAVPTAAVVSVAGLGIAIAAANPTAVAAADPAAIVGTTPAGGVGATEGAYDTAVNRNALIATVAEIKVTANANRTLALDLKARQAENLTELTELKLDIATLSTTAVEIKGQLNALLVALRTAGIVTP